MGKMKKEGKNEDAVVTLDKDKNIVGVNGVEIIGLRMKYKGGGHMTVVNQGTATVTNRDGTKKDFVLLELKYTNGDGMVISDWGLIDAKDRDNWKGDNDEEKE